MFFCSVAGASVALAPTQITDGHRQRVLAQQAEQQRRVQAQQQAQLVRTKRGTSPSGDIAVANKETICCV